MSEIIDKLRSMNLNLMPLKAMSKEPIEGTNWKNLQSEKYNGVFPDDCNLAIICGRISGNLFVIDLDDETLYEEFKEFHDKTMIVKTGKGYHLYFRTNVFLPQNRKLEDKRGRKIDIKSEGGYVLAPSSIHPDTKKRYFTISDKPILVTNADKIEDKLRSLGFDIDKTNFRDIEKGVGEGSRNDATFKYACYLIRDKGLYGEALRKEVDELNKRHKPPLPQGEINIIISQALSYEGSKIKPSKEILTIENLEKEIEKIEGDTVNIFEKFPEYIKELGEDSVKKIILEKTGRDIKFTLVKPLQEITPEFEGITVEFNAVIIAVGDRMTYTREADFICEDETEHVECDELYMIDIPYCKKHKRNYIIDNSTKKTGYIQFLRIQEFLESARNNSPIEFDAQITNENVGEAFFNDRKTFKAKFRSIPQPKGFNKIVFEILEMKNLDQKEDCMPSHEELTKWKSDPLIFDKVRESIAPEILVNPKIKESYMLAVTNGNSLNGKRELIHVATIGDAQLGKSEMLKFIHKMIPGSGYTIGTQTSGAGLTIGMVKLHNGMSIPQAGLLPRHNGKPVIIDEADKMDPKDISYIYSSMEQLTATLTKAGSSGLTLPTECPILLGANPKNGKFNPKYPSVMDNFNFSVPFLSRFDIIWLMIDENNPELDRVTRKHIREFESNKEKYMTIEELQRFFSYARTVKATVPENLLERIDKLHEKMRPLNKMEGLPIGWRQYYGLYRLLTASAATHLREVVTEEDFVIVEEIIRESLKSLRMNIDTGEVESPMQKKRETKQRIFLETWSAVMDENASVDRDDFISELAKHEPYNDLNAGREFEDQLRAGLIEIDNDTGRYRRVVK